MHTFFSRRLGRKPYWLLVLLNFVVATVLSWLISFVLRHVMIDDRGLPNPTSYFWFTYPGVLPLLYLPASIGTIWRLHDTGHGSWPVWLSFAFQICSTYLWKLMVWAVLAAGIHGLAGGITALYGFYALGLLLSGLYIWVLYLCCLPGDEGPNAYGPPSGDAPEDDAPSSPQPEFGSEPVRPAVAPPRPRASSKPSFGKRGA
jgi:uncharacterized membrane protein YhaH (DUF805 family)